MDPAIQQGDLAFAAGRALGSVNGGSRMRVAGPGDIPRLVELMVEFYAESGHPCDPARAAAAFDQLVRDPRLGRVWLLEHAGRSVGYAVLTLGYSLEYGGRDAIVDDLFVQAPYRSRGLGTAAIEEAKRACIALGVRALHLEVARDNHGARELYRKAGFLDHDRLLLTLPLGEPLNAKR
jgi:GNAT superfamily N-acetyltransferase